MGSVHGSVLNRSYASHPCLTFGVLKHVYEARVERPPVFLSVQSWERKTKQRGFACTNFLRCVLGLRVLYKQNFWYIFWDVWKIDSNKYTILYGRWIIQCLRMWTGEWINAKRLFLLWCSGLLFLSPVNVPRQSQQRDIFTSIFLKISDLLSFLMRTEDCRPEGGSLQLMFKAPSSESR